MSADARDSVDSLQMLSDLPDMVGSDGHHDEETISSTLRATAERLGADRAFVAIRDERGRVRVLANHEIALVSARALSPRAWELLADQDLGHPRVWSRAADDKSWAVGLKQNRRPLDAVVGFRLFDAESGLEGLFYFDSRVDEGGGLPFNGEALALASTYVDLLRQSVLRSARTRPSLETEDGPFARVITQSDRVRDVLELCAKVAPSPYTVLFTGETGTGKGLLAQIVHDLSPRVDEALISVNCAAIPETLLESELFGHVRGAFTGAERDKDGLIVAANRGTLFLDEIGKMPKPMQAKLLQFLDSREIRPVGSSRSRAVDVRVICASKRDFETMVADGEFLEDLYYRLVDFPIVIPPLRERGDDIVLLAQEFVERSSEDLGRVAPTLTRGFVAQMRAYRWPGNVRELEKVVRRAVVLAGSEARLREAHLPASLHATTGDAAEAEHSPVRPMKEQVADLERSILQRTLDSLDWNRSETARQLKISYPTLLQKIRNYRLRENC
jgi:DNA-binding NtrC family response regulator